MKKDKTLILNAIKLHYAFRSNSDFAAFLGIAPQTLSSWYSRNSIDYDLVYAKCVELDANWLLTGEGEMLKATAEHNAQHTGLDYKDKYLELLERHSALQDRLVEQQDRYATLQDELQKKDTQFMKGSSKMGAR